MAVLAKTTAYISLLDPLKCKIKSYIAHEDIVAGQAIYSVTASGKAGLATAAAANNLAQFRGIALKSANAGYAVDVVEEGEIAGFTLAGVLDYDAPVYLSDTAGSLDTGAGSVTVPVGTVSSLTDGPTLTKVLNIQVARHHIWA